MFEGLTIIFILFGMAFIMFSLIISEKNQEGVNDFDDEEFKAKIEELNNKIFDVNEYSSFIKKELDDKHKELLFLYQMINEKTASLNKNQSDGNNTSVKINVEENYSTNSEIVAKNNNEMIIDLASKGYSINEIAKMLSIGQGEVKLVLDLYN